MHSIYLDNHSTTPIDPAVREAMQACWNSEFGNPHARSHIHGWKAAEELEKARAKVARLVGAKTGQVIFTSGATESNNIAIQGIAKHIRALDGRKHIVVGKGEHPCVGQSCRYLEREGFQVSEIELMQDGVIQLEAFKQALDGEGVALACLMLANNEIGTLQPVATLAKIASQKQIFFHCDATQACGRIEVNFPLLHVSSLTFAAHKLYGSAGIGALVINAKARSCCQPLMFGGKQEGGLRPGTVPLSLAVGFGKACDLASELMMRDQAHFGVLSDMLLKGLDEADIQYEINGSMTQRLPGNLNLYFDGIMPEEMLQKIQGISVATGSACSSGNNDPSVVLKAIQRDPSRKATSLRFSFGRFNTVDDVERALAILINALG